MALTFDLALAVDVGGTKLAAALVAPDGTVVDRRSAATPPGDGDEVWRALEVVLVGLTAGHDVVGVGIASAAPMDVRAGTVSPVNIRGWRGFPLVDRVSALVPGVPVRLAGDAVCMALAEYHHGAGRGSRALLGMVVSTGVGGGFVFDGRAHLGALGNAGHVGHFVLEPGGPLCACGARGCSEAIASGPSIVRWASDRGWLAAGVADGRSLAASARAGDPIARAAFRRSGEAVARVITVATALCEVDRVVIGGGVAQAWDLLGPAVTGSLAGWPGLDFIRHVDVHPAQLGVDAGLVGAAALVREPAPSAGGEAGAPREPAAGSAR
ncbi:ROK family protein [Umezawaea sp.]|uniref:ROK family protein n=1 Tax=Umezawaea sp. TaxID=1955258 RepID=UPI002ED50DD8